MSFNSIRFAISVTPGVGRLNLGEDLGAFLHAGLDLHVVVVRDADFHGHGPEALGNRLVGHDVFHHVVRPAALDVDHGQGLALLGGDGAHGLEGQHQAVVVCCTERSI